MARELTDEQIQKEQDIVLKGARPIVNKKEFREKQRLQRESDLAFLVPETKEECDARLKRFEEELESRTME